EHSRRATGRGPPQACHRYGHTRPLDAPPSGVAPGQAGTGRGDSDSGPRFASRPRSSGPPPRSIAGRSADGPWSPGAGSVPDRPSERSGWSQRLPGPDGHVRASGPRRRPEDQALITIDHPVHRETLNAAVGSGRETAGELRVLQQHPDPIRATCIVADPEEQHRLPISSGTKELDARGNASAHDRHARERGLRGCEPEGLVLRREREYVDRTEKVPNILGAQLAKQVHSPIGLEGRGERTQFRTQLAVPGDRHVTSRESPKG